MLDAVLAGCSSTNLLFHGGSPAPLAPRAAPAASSAGALALYDDNGNGCITFAEARRYGIAPVPRDHPAYPFMRYGDGASRSGSNRILERERAARAAAQLAPGATRSK